MKAVGAVSKTVRPLAFVEFGEEEALAYQWDTGKVKKIIENTILEVKQHLTLENVTVTVLPALSFPWFEKMDRS